MLSGEGNENGGKTTIGLISQKQLGSLQHTFFYISLPLFCTATETSETLCLYFPFFSFSSSTKIKSVDLFWLHDEFTRVTRTSKNAVSPPDGTIASRSINTEGGSAALVLTRKQDAIARSFPSFKFEFF